jgi:ABC-type methionine transport system ATPase subunit
MAKRKAYEVLDVTTTPSRQTIQQLQELTARLEKAVEEGRGLLKDLRAEKQSLMTFINSEAEAVCIRAAETQVDRMTKILKGKMDVAVKHIDGEFEKLQNLYTGRDGRPAGDPTIEDMTAFAKVTDYFKRTGKFPEYG